MPRALPEPPPREELATVVECRTVATGHHTVRLTAPYCAQHSQPGSFVQMRVSDHADPFLRRPMSVGGTDNAAGTIDVVFKVTGTGTSILSSAKPGNRLSVVGPLGKPFHLPESGNVLLVGGGVGMPPLFFAATRLDPARTTVVQGARTADLLLYREEFAELGVGQVIATDDGSAGHSGFVTEPLERILSDTGTEPFAVLACGPTPMLMAVARIAQKCGVPCQLSLEEHMACGIGICMGCAVRRADIAETTYDLVCVDGPVFEASQIAGQSGEIEIG